jgi:hypothetical protein
MSTLYEEDFYSWTQEQAAVLRRAAELRLNAPGDADWEHLAEEVEDMGISLLRELYSRYTILVAHLLKWRYQPEARSSSWRGTINTQRRHIADLVWRNPGVKPKRQAELGRAYEGARELAADDSDLPLETFPKDNPFTLEEVEDRAFWPEPVPSQERS